MAFRAEDPRTLPASNQLYIIPMFFLLREVLAPKRIYLPPEPCPTALTKRAMPNVQAEFLSADQLDLAAWSFVQLKEAVLAVVKLCLGDQRAQDASGCLGFKLSSPKAELRVEGRVESGKGVFDSFQVFVFSV